MMDASLLEILACPWCLGELDPAPDRLTCKHCGAVYRTEDGLPHMIVEEAELHCPQCKRILAKRGRNAMCTECGRHFRMDVRVQGTLEDHARRYCPRCDPKEIEMDLHGNDYICPHCDAHYPVQGK